MAFTPKDWRDYPDTTTPITAAALEDAETRLADYTDDLASGFDVAAVQGLKALTFDPAGPGTNFTAADGQLHVTRVYLPAPQDVATLKVYVTVAGSGLTGVNRVALYKTDGTLVAKTEDLASVLTSSGEKTGTLTAEAGQSITPLPAGNYYIAALFHGTTRPSIRCRGATSAALASFGLATGEYRTATLNSQTDFPSPLNTASLTDGTFVALAGLA